VCVGSATYTFSPGRDFTVGRDIESDICLDDPDSQWASRIHLLLRFNGTHWVAIDRSLNGTYLDGERVSIVKIRDGHVITVAGPQEGPRLVFQVGGSTSTPPTPTDTGSPKTSAEAASSSSSPAATNRQRSRPVPRKRARRSNRAAKPKPAPARPPAGPAQPKSPLDEPKPSAGEPPPGDLAPPAEFEPPGEQAPVEPAEPTPPGELAPAESAGPRPASESPPTEPDQAEPAGEPPPGDSAPVAPPGEPEQPAALPGEPKPPPGEQPPTDSVVTAEFEPPGEQAPVEPAQPIPEPDRIGPPGEPPPGDSAPPAEVEPANREVRGASAGQAQPPIEPPRIAQQAEPNLVDPTRRRLPGPVGSSTIGRSPDSDIMVADALVSRVHATVVPTVDGLEVQDNNSSNGTFVNGERIDRVLLREGDVVTVGNADFAVLGTTLASRPASETGGLRAHRLSLTADGHQVLTDVSFTARPGTLTAIMGPAGAGKSSLTELLCGAMRPRRGLVLLDGHNVHAEYASVRSRIGLVPQDDAIHHRLTVEQALGYAAELRLPADTSVAERHQVVNCVIDELELAPYRTTRIDRLSGARRKRVSVAMELLTAPSLLILDEPSVRPDRPLGDQVMTMARQLADTGRVVVAVTHSLNYLHLCQQVVLLASGGKTAFIGPPDQIEAAMGTADWVDIFVKMNTDPEGAHAAFLARQRALTRSVLPPVAPVGPPDNQARTSLRRQIFSVAHRPPRPRASTLAVQPPAVTGHSLHTSWHRISAVARRQVRLLVADRGYFIFLAMLPFLLGALSLAVPGDLGRGAAASHGDSRDQVVAFLVMLNIAAVFMGTALSIRDLVGERFVFWREQSIGLSAPAYLTAKIFVFGAAAIVQAGVLTTIVVVGKGAPTHGGVLFGDPIAELYLTVCTTALVSAIGGLCLSSLAERTTRTLPMFVVTIAVSLVLCGGTFPLAGQIGLEQISWLLPARWGLAASASVVDVSAISPLAANDPLWTHSALWWVFDMIMLMVIGGACTGFLRWRLRLT
jgi:ABC-type multidrug transport system ATPase subunit